ncbi:LysR family transcriptional regulator [Enterococcus hulanensis]|uniref:LysR family transcriptional regulator n=1 Tax=Enterococcus hulanensis TaxID=2559929 RepID=A0ABU3EU62_9ENTE|nr:LysR family transcriptional regulator [Enterococcus hulanensis]MDT2598405.1 LysR family transcriptional regulator [Enterococcus hulanensis]MDT2608090.1 LysR family transcriptional regulator [Enterococcus hulanensis]MDT2615385.1 LysR family transcriptional regulator [Enterococcus hulanensis]MDT2626644.1 LysR family transcriptional regulator [Enterococcus hulanensis]MDT2654457.1 LysR family transcriptional regulator [Enterococcus hulanensis]
MEIRLLRYFWAVAQEGNISRASRILNITQPTLSRQIKELEERIGAPLFHREKNRLSLTKDGYFLKERAEEILALDEKLEQAFSAQRNEQLSGTISIGCVEADNSDTVAMLLEELISDYPQIQFNLVTGTSDDISDRLEKGILDLAILLEPVILNEVETLILPREERWGFLVSKEMFIAEKEFLKPEDIKGLPILCSNRSEVQNLLSGWSGEPLDQLNIVGNFNLIFNVLPLVNHKVGAALSVEGAILDRRLEEAVFIPLQPSVKTHCVLVWKKRVQTPAVQELINRFNHAFKL